MQTAVRDLLGDELFADLICNCRRHTERLKLLMFIVTPTGVSDFCSVDFYITV